MPSWQAHAASVYLRATRKRRYRTHEDGERSLAQGLPAAEPPASLAGRVTSERMAGAQVHRVVPADGAPHSRGQLVYWHGGGFINGIATQHWKLIDHLVSATGREALVPQYGLAPGNHLGDAMDLLGAVLDVVHGPVHVLGDSAGGTLALLQAHLHPGRIAGLTLIAPWLDLAMGNPAVDAVEPRDPWLTRAGLRPAASAWARGRDLRDPHVSPLFGDHDQLPPTLVIVGDRDICMPDCQVLAECAGSSVRLQVGPGLPHVYPLLPIPEARPAREQIVKHVVETLAER